MRETIERVYLTGFMGSGKSTFAPILANIIGWDFYDLDTVIEKLEHRIINEIFQESGEKYFRQKESEVLKELSALKNAVISLGGGAIVQPENLLLIRTTGKLVYLKVPVEVIFARLKSKGDRPLLLDEQKNPLPQQVVLKKINQLLTEREQYYNQADLIFESGKMSLGKSADELYKRLNRMYRFAPSI